MNEIRKIRCKWERIYDSQSEYVHLVDKFINSKQALHSKTSPIIKFIFSKNFIKIYLIDEFR